MITGPIHISV